jgi:hypothetical protein
MERAAFGPVDALLTAYTSAGRRLGRAPLGPVPELSLAHWMLEDAGRSALLLSRGEQEDDEDFAAAAIGCFEQGDAREQQSWLRAVHLLPAGDRFVTLVVDACRTNVLPVFEAVACENPYPSQRFSDLHFNQMVLKAMFNSVALSRVVGLQRRQNPELTRMAAAYASERRAAGRPVPVDISLAMGDQPFVQELR